MPNPLKHTIQGSLDTSKSITFVLEAFNGSLFSPILLFLFQEVKDKSKGKGREREGGKEGGRNMIFVFTII